MGRQQQLKRRPRHTVRVLEAEEELFRAVENARRLGIAHSVRIRRASDELVDAIEEEVATVEAVQIFS